MRQPINRGPALTARRFADRNYARRPLAPFIDRRIDIRNASRQRLAERDANGADMRPHDDVDIIKQNRVLGAPNHVFDRAAGVKENDFDLSPKDAASFVDLGGCEQCAVRSGRPPNSR